MGKSAWLVSVAGGLAAVLLSSGAAHAEPPELPEALRAKAAATGHVRVIVGFRLPGPGFKPEGELAGPAEVAEQRRAIEATRTQLLDALRGFNAQEYRSWESVPAVGLKVDAAALDLLAHHPLVTSIQEDALSGPS